MRLDSLKLCFLDLFQDEGVVMQVASSEFLYIARTCLGGKPTMATKFGLARLRSESMGRRFLQRIQIQGLANCLAPPQQQSLTSPPASSQSFKF